MFSIVSRDPLPQLKMGQGCATFPLTFGGDECFIKDGGAAGLRWQSVGPVARLMEAFFRRLKALRGGGLETWLAWPGVCDSFFYRAGCG
jgi:hypothetical protein